MEHVIELEKLQESLSRAPDNVDLAEFERQIADHEKIIADQQGYIDSLVKRLPLENEVKKILELREERGDWSQDKKLETILEPLWDGKEWLDKLHTYSCLTLKENVLNGKNVDERDLLKQAGFSTCVELGGGVEYICFPYIPEISTSRQTIKKIFHDTYEKCRVRKGGILTSCFIFET